MFKLRIPRMRPGLRPRIAAAWLLIAALLPLQGCGNSRDIQNLAYVTALGVDYEGGKYVTYAQVLNFSNIARTENAGGLGKKVPVWIGVGHGESVTEAIDDMNTTSQFPLFWGHLKVIVMSERAAKLGVKEIYLTLNRYREIRYNVFVYGTKEKLADILTSTSLFNLSPLDTVMFTGTQLDSAQAFLLPMNGNRGIALLNEPGVTQMLPTVSTSDETWHEDQAPAPLLYMNGAFFLEKDQAYSWMSVSDLSGIRWANTSLIRTPLQVPLGGGKRAMIMCTHPRLKIKPVVTGGTAYFDIAVRVKGTVYQMRSTPIASLQHLAEKTIEQEIRATYRKAVAKRGDPFLLEETLYRKQPAVFRKLTGASRFFLDEKSLRRVKVSLSITSTGKYSDNVK